MTSRIPGTIRSGTRCTRCTRVELLARYDPRDFAVLVSHPVCGCGACGAPVYVEVQILDAPP